MLTLTRATKSSSIALASFLAFSCGPNSEDSGIRQAISDSVSAPATGVYDNGTEAPLKRLLDSANTSLDIEIYEMHAPQIIKSLLAAKERGVDIRVIVEPAPVGTECGFDEAESGDCEGDHDNYEKLQNAGIQVVPFNKELCGGGSGICVMHGKLVVADAKRALVSTGNFNGANLCGHSGVSAGRCNRDWSVIIDDQPSVRTLAKIFAKDFIGDVYDVRAVMNEEPNHRVTVSPVSQPEVLAFLKKATESIELQAQYLKEAKLNGVLTDMAKKGVEVRATVASVCSFGKISDSEAEKTRELLEPMAEAGVDIQMYTKLNKIAGKSAYMHSKVYLVDGKKAWVGSINGSYAAFKSNREFGVFFDNPEWVSKLGDIVGSDHDSEKNEGWKANLSCEKEFGG